MVRPKLNPGLLLLLILATVFFVAALFSQSATSGGVKPLAPPLTSTAIMTGGGGIFAQTPSATSTLSAAGVMNLAGSISTGGATAPSLPTGTNSCWFGQQGSNYSAWCVPTTLSQQLALNFPNANPTAHSIMIFPAPTSGVAQFVFSAFPNCLDSVGQHLNYATGSDTITCGTSSSGGNPAISTLTAAAGSNTIANGNNPQTWNWAQTTDAQDALTLGETSAATNGTLTNGLANQAVLHLATLTASTETPLEIDQGSITGTVAFPAAQIETTWNNAGLTAIGLIFNVTDTASNAASLLFDFRKGNTSQINGDKNGNLKALTSVQTGTAPACTAGTAGAWCATEGTNATNVAGAGVLNPNSTTHELAYQSNGSALVGMLVRAQPSAINQTAQTAAIGTATLCAASAGACNVAGQYHVHWNFWGSGTACANVTAGSVTFLLSWTDENAVAHAAVALQMMAQTGAATSAMQASFPFQTALANESAGGDLTISTNGTVIQYATGYTACTTGTGTYNLRATVTRLQ